MVYDPPPFDLGFALEFLLVLLGFGVIYGTLRSDLRNMKAEIKDHRDKWKAIEELNIDVSGY